MNIYRNIFCGALLLSAAALTGCSDEESYDVRGEKTCRVFVDQNQSNVTECTVYKTPIGLCGDAAANVHVQMQYPASNPISVTGTVDPTLVSQYNEDNGTQYAALPDAAVKAVETTPATMESGSNKADLVMSLPTEARTSLTETDYVMPVRIAVDNNVKDNGRDVSVLDGKDIAYMVMHVSDQNIASLQSKHVTACTVVKTPVGTFGGVDAKYTVSLKSSVYTDVKLSAEIDNSLIADYNAQNGTSYEALPAEFANALTIEQPTIAPGELEGAVSMTMPMSKAEQLDGSYIIPMHIAMTYSDGTKETFDTPVYTTIDIKESLINDNPTALLGTKQSDVSAWTCTEAVNFDKDAFKGNDSWKPTAARISESSFTIDLGATHKVSSLRDIKSSSYVIESYKLAVSEDGKTWTDLGDVNNCGTYRESYNSSWIVLYGGISARYLKYEIKYNPNSYYWNYYNYSWGAAYVGVNVQLAFDD